MGCEFSKQRGFIKRLGISLFNAVDSPWKNAHFEHGLDIMLSLRNVNAFITGFLQQR